MINVINVYCKDKVVLNWVHQVQKELSGHYFFKFHRDLNSLKNELDLKNEPSVVLIDVEDNHYHLFTKSHFKGNKFIKFIGIGSNKETLEIINFFNNNLISYLSIENNSLDLIKAINKARLGKYYLCEDTAEKMIHYFLNNNIVEKPLSDFTIQSIDNRNSNNLENTKKLTEREKNTANLLKQGLTYKEISTVLGITTFTVNQICKNLYKKMNVRSRAELSYKLAG